MNRDWIRDYLFDEGRQRLLRLGVSGADVDARVERALDEYLAGHPEPAGLEVIFSDGVPLLLTPEEQSRWLSLEDDNGWSTGEQERIEIVYRKQVGRCKPVVHCPRDGAPLTDRFLRVPEGSDPEFPWSTEFLGFACEECGRSLRVPW